MHQRLRIKGHVTLSMIKASNLPRGSFFAVLSMFLSVYSEDQGSNSFRLQCEGATVAVAMKQELQFPIRYPRVLALCLRSLPTGLLPGQYKPSYGRSPI
jgi:hypothetical protein